MDWWVTVLIAFGSAIVGAIIGSILPIFVREKCLRPKLEIIKEESVVPLGESGYGHRVFVKNTGRRAAVNCIGLITLNNVQKDEDIVEFEYRYFDEHGCELAALPIMTKDRFTKIEDMPVCWAWLRNPASIVINRDTPQALDVYIVQKKSRILVIPTEKGWKLLRIALRADKKYEGMIRVTSANAEPALPARFELIPQENGDVKLNITERS